MNREEHLNWCKERALELIELGHLKEALDSIYSDLNKHPETKNHPCIIQGYMLQKQGRLQTETRVKAYRAICNMKLSEKIKTALASSEKTPGAIKDEIGTTYPEIFTALSQLVEAGEVEHRFAGEGAGAVLCYRLARKIILPMFGSRA